MGATRRAVRAATAVGALALIAGCAGGGGGTSGAAACVAPEATASPATAAPGARVTVSFERLMADCYDTGQGLPNPPVRRADLVLHYADGSTSDVLATVDADADLRAEVTVTVPADAPRGPASVWVGTIPFDVLTVDG